MGRKYEVISADGHVESSPDRWVTYIPDKYKERAPRLVKLEDGGEGWQVEGLPLMQNGLNLTGGSPIRYTNESYWEPDGTPRPGTGGPEQRLAEQDRDGIDAEVLFPPVFASRFIEHIADSRVYLALVRAYNDFLADYCAIAPDRLIGNGIIPVTGIDDAVSELKRCKGLGLRSVSPRKFPNGGGTVDGAVDDKFWDTALELGMRISPHNILGDTGPNVNLLSQASSTGPAPLANIVSGDQPRGCMWAIAQLIASGTLNRFPDLKMYFAETNASWMPSALFFMDDSWDQRSHLYSGRHPLTMKPSEYVKEHFLFSIIRDPLALALRDYLPVDHLMWGTDFPHSVGSFPESKKWIDIIFQAVPSDLKQKVLLDNPVAFFGLDPDADLTETSVAATAGR